MRIDSLVFMVMNPPAIYAMGYILSASTDSVKLSITCTTYLAFYRYRYRLLVGDSAHATSKCDGGGFFLVAQVGVVLRQFAVISGAGFITATSGKCGESNCHCAKRRAGAMVQLPSDAPRSPR